MLPTCSAAVEDVRGRYIYNIYNVYVYTKYNIYILYVCVKVFSHVILIIETFIEEDTRY